MRRGECQQYAEPVATRTQSDNLLRLSRCALATGDVRRAVDLLNQAKRLQVRYGPLDDSPERAEAAISKYQEIVTLDRNTEAGRRAYARMLMEQAEALVHYGEFDVAEQLADRAAQQAVTYGPFEPKPQNLLAQISAARRQNDALIRPLAPPAGVRPMRATGNPEGLAIVGEDSPPGAVTPVVYNPNQDRRGTCRRRAMQAAPSGSEPAAVAYTEPVRRAPAVAAAARRASARLRLRRRRRRAAGSAVVPSAATGRGGRRALRRATPCSSRAKPRCERMTATGPINPSGRPSPISTNSIPPPPSGYWITCSCFPRRMRIPARWPSARRPSTRTVAKQQALARQLATELERQESQAHSLMEKDSKGALALLEQERKKIEAAGLAPQYRDALLRNCDRNIADVQQFIARNGPRLELNEKNARTRQEIEREKQEKLDRQQKIAALVDEYNHLMDEQRCAEAEVVAKQAAELDPRNPVVEQLLLRSRFVRMYRDSMDIKDQQEKMFGIAMNNVERAAIPFDDMDPYQFPDPKNWKELTEPAFEAGDGARRRRNEQEIEIEKKLKTPVVRRLQGHAVEQGDGASWRGWRT